MAAKIVPIPSFRGYRLAGFNLGGGSGNSLVDCVTVGNLGNTGATGFIWPESGSGLWTFQGCVAHNNKTDGLFVWQNNTSPQLIEDFVAFRNRYGIEHGAYHNPFAYERCATFENGVASCCTRFPLNRPVARCAGPIRTSRTGSRSSSTRWPRRTRRCSRTPPARRSSSPRRGGHAGAPTTSSGLGSNRRIGPSRPWPPRASTACSVRMGRPTASTRTARPQPSLRSPDEASRHANRPRMSSHGLLALRCAGETVGPQHDAPSVRTLSPRRAHVERPSARCIKAWLRETGRVPSRPGA